MRKKEKKKRQNKWKTIRFKDTRRIVKGVGVILKKAQENSYGEMSIKQMRPYKNVQYLVWVKFKYQQMVLGALYPKTDVKLYLSIYKY